MTSRLRFAIRVSGRPHGHPGEVRHAARPPSGSLLHLRQRAGARSLRAGSHPTFMCVCVNVTRSWRTLSSRRCPSLAIISRDPPFPSPLRGKAYSLVPPTGLHTHCISLIKWGVWVTFLFVCGVRRHCCAADQARGAQVLVLFQAPDCNPLNIWVPRPKILMPCTHFTRTLTHTRSACSAQRVRQRPPPVVAFSAKAPPSVLHAHG